MLISDSFLGDMSIQILCPFKTELLSSLFIMLFILDTSLLPDIQRVSIFSQCTTCFFIFLIGSFETQRCLIWWNPIYQSFFFYGFFMDCTFGAVSKNSLSNPGTQDLFLIFLSWSFIVLALKQKVSYNPIWVNFYGVN